MKADWDLFKRLSEVQAVSAYETPVARLILEAVRDVADDAFVDGFGNAIARRSGSEGKRTLLVAAHQDEIGLMVKYIREDGFLRVTARGNLMMKYLIGREVEVLGENGPVFGILESEDQGIHGIVDATEAERGGAPVKLTVDDLFVDLGVDSKADAEKLGIRVGDPVALRAEFRRFPDRGIGIGKAVDDRIGCFIMVESLRRVAERGHRSTLYIAGTAQEESINLPTALRGAEVAARHIQPDAALILEPVLVGGMPGPKEDKDLFPIPARFRGGPVLFRGADCHPRFTGFIMQVCEELGLPHQLRVGYDFGTDALRIRASGRGVATAILGPTTRYHHTPHQMVSIEDTEACIELVTEVLARFDESVDLDLG